MQNISSLSTEAVLSILSYLNAADLATISKVSKKFQILADDEVLWHNLFEENFPRLGNQAWDRGALADLSWKSKYRLRYNWSAGRCHTRRFDMMSGGDLVNWSSRQTETFKDKRTIVQSIGSRIFTASRKDGLRAWNFEGHLEAKFAEENPERFEHYLRDDLDVYPFGLETRSMSFYKMSKDSDSIFIVRGMDLGPLELYSFSSSLLQFTYLTYQLPPNKNRSAVIETVCEPPFLVVLTDKPFVYVYSIEDISKENDMKLITSLSSPPILGPTSLSIRKENDTIDGEVVIAAIGYFQEGIGQTTQGPVLQEICLSVKTRSILQTRVAIHEQPPRRNFQFSHALRLMRPVSTSRIIQIVHSHPFLISVHSDNTLTLYKITASRHDLKISFGSRLWGHTTGVQDVRISGYSRRAVSAAPDGTELRIWDLDTDRGTSVQIARDPEFDDDACKIVGFDDRHVIVERLNSIVIYDFMS
ncbi:uncharacterized protein V1516DRAFT_629749 [Lipomyces oligophaga]|uniref:uncharacterized protein n=1 Tax=Lipomyces oligophaga TaxID=45792 RepID=UPI0034CE0C29